jgi:hypothetical protein
MDSNISCISFSTTTAKEEKKVWICGQEGHRKKYKDKLTCPQYVKDTQAQEMLSIA